MNDSLQDHHDRIKELEDVVKKLCTIIDDIHESLEHVLERLHVLEECNAAIQERLEE